MVRKLQNVEYLAEPKERIAVSESEQLAAVPLQDWLDIKVRQEGLVAEDTAAIGKFLPGLRHVVDKDLRQWAGRCERAGSCTLMVSMLHIADGEADGAILALNCNQTRHSEPEPAQASEDICLAYYESVPEKIGHAITAEVMRLPEAPDA